METNLSVTTDLKSKEIKDSGSSVMLKAFFFFFFPERVTIWNRVDFVALKVGMRSLVRDTVADREI